MPVFLLIVAAVFIAVGINDKSTEFNGLLKSAFAPQDGGASFISWLFAFVIIGAIGYIPKLKPISNAFLVLLIVILFLSHKGFIAKLQDVANIKGTKNE
jgi:hypothetical protein